MELCSFTSVFVAVAAATDFILLRLSICIFEITHTSHESFQVRWIPVAFQLIRVLFGHQFDKSWDFIFRRKRSLMHEKFKIRSVSGQTHASIKNAMLSKQFVFGIPEAIEVNKRTNEQNHTVCMCTVIWAKRYRGRARQAKKEHPVCDHWNLIFSSRVYHIECNMLSPARRSIWLMTSA